MIAGGYEEFKCFLSCEIAEALLFSSNIATHVRKGCAKCAQICAQVRILCFVEQARVAVRGDSRRFRLVASRLL